TRALQRWRVDLALRAVDQLGCDRVVFTGGTPTTDHVEAITMAANAAEKGLDPSLMALRVAVGTGDPRLVPGVRSRLRFL
ncbi:MAG: hypothetical protein WCC60_11465, partial [Ilumatobacteraceae bacterium]